MYWMFLTVQWCTTFLLKDEDGKQIGKDARLFTHSDSFNYEKWRRTQSELVKKFCTRKGYAQYAGPVRVVLKCSDHKHKQDMNCNIPEDWGKKVEILLYWHREMKRKALIADITWMWSRHEPGDSSSEGGFSEVEGKKQCITLLLISFINFIRFRCVQQIVLNKKR